MTKILVDSTKFLYYVYYKFFIFIYTFWGSVSCPGTYGQEPGEPGVEPPALGYADDYQLSHCQPKDDNNNNW